jgi:hypothetical protein
VGTAWEAPLWGSSSSRAADGGATTGGGPRGAAGAGGGSAGDGDLPPQCTRAPPSRRDLLTEFCREMEHEGEAAGMALAVGNGEEGNKEESNGTSLAFCSSPRREQRQCKRGGRRKIFWEPVKREAAGDGCFSGALKWRGHYCMLRFLGCGSDSSWRQPNNL